MITHRLRSLAHASVAAALVAGVFCCTVADAATLSVNVSARGNQRSTWQDAFDKFKKANPDVDLKVTYVTEEAYKVQMGGWLATDPPDVVSWHDGERMAYYAERGLLEDLSPDWSKNGWSQQYASVKEGPRTRASSTRRHSATTLTDSSIARICSRRPASRVSRKRGMNFSMPARS